MTRQTTPKLSQILSLITPVQPDTLHHVATGIYAAAWRWRGPMQIEILKRTPNIVFFGAANGRRWQSAYFCVSSDRPAPQQPEELS